MIYLSHDETSMPGFGCRESGKETKNGLETNPTGGQGEWSVVMIFFVLGDGDDGSSKKEIDAEWEGVLQR